MTPRLKPNPALADERPTTVLDAVPDPQPADEPERAEGSPVLRLIAQTQAERRARADRMANLFPRPDDCDWSIRELAYERRRRAPVS